MILPQSSFEKNTKATTVFGMPFLRTLMDKCLNISCNIFIHLISGRSRDSCLRIVCVCTRLHSLWRQCHLEHLAHGRVADHPASNADNILQWYCRCRHAAPSSSSLSVQIHERNRLDEQMGAYTHRYRLRE